MSSSFSSSCLPTRYFWCIRQSDRVSSGIKGKKPWSRRKEEAKAQHGSLGKCLVKQAFFPPKLESQPPATGLRKPKSPKVPGRVLGRVPGKRGLLGGLLGAVLGGRFLWKSRETAVPPFSRHSSQHSPQHFWGFGLPQSCSRWLGFQPQSCWGRPRCGRKRYI